MPMPSESERTSLERATQAYEADIHLAEEYLAARGIPLETARTYRLGYVTAANAQPGDTDMIGRLALPFITPYGGVIDMRFRDISGQARAKYLSKPGSHTRLFNVGALVRASKFVCITEGEFDAIAAEMSGLHSVGVPGASNWQPHYPLLFEERQVFVLCDGDAAGREFGKKVASSIDGCTVIPMPDGMDVNEVYVAHGANELRRKVGMDA